MSNFKYNAKRKWEKKQRELYSRIGKSRSKFVEDELKMREYVMTRHHVPPKFSDYEPRIIKVDERHHNAYHLLFGNPATFEDACYILKRDWWPDKD